MIFIGSDCSPLYSGEAEPRLFHAAHVLPHSYWSTARQHEWLFYAGAIPNGNARYRGLEKFKYTEKNILWLAIHLANLMEPTIGEVIVVPMVRAPSASLTGLD